MRILILGANGLIGSNLAKGLSSQWSVIPTAKEKVDVTDPRSLRAAFERHRPDVVVNCAGFMNVDRCEKDPRQSRLVNGLGAINVARELLNSSAARTSTLIHLSSDFVFDGSKGAYIEEDAAKPLSYYGVHKLIADEMICSAKLHRYYVLRVASVIAFAAERSNFIKKMISIAKERDHFNIVDDLSISLCTAELLSYVISALLERSPPPGLYHSVASGTTSWYRILTSSFQQLGIKYEIRPCSIDTMPNAHLRPRKSDMVPARLEDALGVSMPTWQAALQEHVQANQAEYRSFALASGAIG